MGWMSFHWMYWTGLSIMVLLGVVDDRLDLGSTLKFAVQVIVSLLFVWQTDTHIWSFFNLFGIGPLPVWLGYALSVVVMVFLMNAINLIDGVDGLAGGTTLVSLYLFHTILPSETHSLSWILLSLGLIVFLGYNFSIKRKIFMGDAGSLGLGFILASQALEILQTPQNHEKLFAMNPIIVIVLVLGYPIADTVRVFSIRIFLGLSPFNPDRRHLHHVLLGKGFTHPGVTTFVLSVLTAFYFLNKMLAPILDSHLMILINIAALMGLHYFVKFQSKRVVKFWKFIHHYTFRPVKLLWLKLVDA